MLLHNVWGGGGEGEGGREVNGSTNFIGVVFGAANLSIGSIDLSKYAEVEVADGAERQQEPYQVHCKQGAHRQPS